MIKSLHTSIHLHKKMLCGAFNKFPDIFVQACKIVIDSWKFSMLLLYTLWAIGIHPTKAWLSQLVNFKNAIWTWRHFRRTICNKIVLNLEKMPQKRTECFRLLFDHLAWIEHQFLSGLKDSRKAGNLWGMMRGVGGVRKSIHQSWLARELGLGLLCWDFKGIQEEIPSGEASTLQIGSVAFPPGQCTSPQLHPYHRLFDQDGHQDSSSPPL